MAFTEAPILQHSNPQQPIILQTDASGFTISGWAFMVMKDPEIEAARLIS
jgi:hypothetical protein